MKNKKALFKALMITLVAPAVLALSAQAAKKTDLIAVSADIVEISGSLTTSKGFAWNQLLDFSESEIPGIFSIGEFERKSLLSTRLRLMETEGKAQILSNPKVIARSNTSANFSAGGSVPYPVVSDRNVGVEFKDYGVRLDVLPTIIPERDKIIIVQLELELSNADYSKPIVVNGSEVPAITKRFLRSEVELNSGETLVIGGLKSSSRSVAEDRVPLFGRIPLIGLLFRTKGVVEEQRSLFLFITVEIVE
ncbi:MAG: type II and III secretion system protein [Elusimicrobiota bacterium]|jgi:pilus assembly protein CpaC|nr:type II and III secretion system protein [Elusimicrobiota bacterium]